MSSTYVQHEYTINLNEPWSLNSNNTEMSSVLDGDEELLILDNSKLAFDDEFDNQFNEGEGDFCRCANCAVNNRAHCLSNRNNNGIAMISNGDILGEVSVNHRNHMLSNNSLEPSPPTVFTHSTDRPVIGHSERNGNNENSHHNHSHGDHNWLTHCHPVQTQTDRSRAVTKANRQLIIGCLLCLIFMLAEVIGGFISNSLAIMTGQYLDCSLY